MEDELDKVVEDLDKRFEHWNFRRVDLGANHLKFIYDGLREKPAAPATEVNANV